MPIGNKRSRMTTARGRRTGQRTFYAPIRRRSAKRVARSESRMRRNNGASLDGACLREGDRTKAMSQSSFTSTGDLEVIPSKASSNSDFDFLVGEWKIRNKKLKTRL